MKLLLFDIDGTLLLTRGAGRRAMEDALGLLFDRPVRTQGVAFAGRTDPLIMRDVLLHNGFSGPEAAALLPRALDGYVEAARRTMVPAVVDILPGVGTLIPRLAGLPHVRLGLVTGNLEATAYLKLRAAGLDVHFPFGAFGSDHPDRIALPGLALDRARVHTGRTFAGPDVVVIGDTAHDIRCGRHVGARVVAVCTGLFSRADLAPHAPDLLLDDLSDTDRFIREVVGEA